MKKSYEVVCAVIKKENLFFTCQRGPGGECEFKWEFPGGKIEINETKEHALIREITEELNTKIKVEKFLTTVVHEYNTFNITMHAYLCTLEEGNLELSEHINKKWVSKEELSSLDLADADKPILKYL